MAKPGDPHDCSQLVEWKTSSEIYNKQIHMNDFTHLYNYVALQPRANIRWGYDWKFLCQEAVAKQIEQTYNISLPDY